MEIDVAEISKELDPTTSLYYFGARYYDAWSGRWLSVDPLGQSTSAYAYCGDEPIGSTDPSGDYSYEINGVRVPQSVGREILQTYAQNYALDQQAEQYQVRIKVNQIIHNLTPADNRVLEATAASEANPWVKVVKELAGIYFVIFNRLAVGYDHASTLSQVIYAKAQFDGVGTPIFNYAMGKSHNFSAYFAMLFNRRIGYARSVLRGIENGSIQNPIGSDLFYHSWVWGKWSSAPFGEFMRYLNSSVRPRGFTQQYYGGTVFFNWTGLH